MYKIGFLKTEKKEQKEKDDEKMSFHPKINEMSHILGEMNYQKFKSQPLEELNQLEDENLDPREYNIQKEEEKLYEKREKSQPNLKAKSSKKKNMKASLISTAKKTCSPIYTTPQHNLFLKF